MTRRLGLIGGLGVAATIHYYRALVDAHRALGASPDILIAHADLARVYPWISAGDFDGLAAYLAALIDRLVDAGAEIAAISAVAPHACAPMLLGMIELPLVDIIDAINGELAARKLDRVALIGAGPVMKSGLFGRLAAHLVVPSEDDASFIADAYAKLAATGAADAESVDRLRAIARRLCEQEGAQSVVLAGTDLAAVFDEESAGFPTVDATRAHVAAIMRRLTDPQSA